MQKYTHLFDGSLKKFTLFTLSHTVRLLDSPITIN